MLARELSQLEDKKEYQEILTRIQKIQRPVLKELEKSLTDTIAEFVPDVRSVHLDTDKPIRSYLSRACSVYINDGTRTLLEMKGDGIKSLTAVALLRYSTVKRSHGKNLILAIEEPESHLHPNAIHRLKNVLGEISEKNQVIASTHSPLFTDRENVGGNIIVAERKASPANSLREIREILGIRISDNLISANLVLLVEGKNDETILKTCLSKSKALKKCFEQGELLTDNLGGAGNLSYKASVLRQKYLYL